MQALFDYTKMTAPFDGVVTWRYADTGAMVAAGTTSERQALPVVKLSQNGLLRLDIPVPETDVPVVRLGKKVSVEVQALNKTFEGTVARFADKVDDATRTMITEVDVPNPNLEIVPGMYAYVSFPVMEKKNALAVPIQAVSREGNRAVTYRVNSGNRIEVLPVTLGIETRSQIEVLSGLSEGDRVVVGNTSQLRPGQRRSKNRGVVRGRGRQLMSRFAIRNPYFIIVLCLFVVVIGLTSLLRMPVDLFPVINIPEVGFSAGGCAGSVLSCGAGADDFHRWFEA